MGATRQYRRSIQYAVFSLWIIGSVMAAVATNEPCGDSSIQLDPSQPYQLQSPGYPADVTTAVCCKWTITASPGMQIKLIARDLHTQEYTGFTIANIQTNDDIDYILNHIREVKLRAVISSSHVIKVEFWTEAVDLSVDSRSKVYTRFWLELQQIDANYSILNDCDNKTTFLCDSGDICVDHDGICDSIIDCPDQSDENKCLNTCASTERCGNGSTCLLRRFHCDGIQDCTTAEDEQACDVRLCPKDCSCQMNNELFRISMMNVNCTGVHNVTSVLQTLPRMTNGIIMRKASITDLVPGTFDKLPFLIRIDLERNQLTRLKLGLFNGLKYLKILRLNMNRLLTIDDGVFQHLTLGLALRLDGNSLVNLTEGMFKGLGNLKFLRLGRNRIRALKSNTFRHLSKLISLDLVNNRISSIEAGAFTGLANLRALHILGNLVTVLETNAFVGMPLINHLDIGANPWVVIQSGAFNGLESLEILNLKRRSNQTQDFSVKKNEMEHLRHLMSLIVDDPKMCCLLDYKTIGIDKCVPDNKFSAEIPYLSCNRIMHNPVLRVFIWCLGISALIGNAGIIIWRLNMKDSGKRSQSVLVLNLAVSDLIMGLYMLIVGGADVHFQDDYFLHAAEWKTGHLCKFAGFLSMLSSEASVFFITMISIDRFLCVVFPFGKKWLRLESARMASATLWAIALLISVPPLFLQGMLNDKNETVFGLYDICVGLPLVIQPKTAVKNYTILGISQMNGTVTHKAGPSWIFSATVYLGINFACCLLVMVCYSAIAYVVIIKLPAKKLHKRKDKEHRKREMTMATRMLLIVGTDFCCWMPVIIMGILSQTGAVDIPDETYAWVVVFVIPINSAINPYLYTFSNANAVSINCCKFGRPGKLVDSVRMKPLTSQTKDTQTGRSNRSGTQSFL